MGLKPRRNSPVWPPGGVFPPFLRAKRRVLKIEPLRFGHRLTAIWNQTDLTCVWRFGRCNQLGRCRGSHLARFVFNACQASREGYARLHARCVTSPASSIPYYRHAPHTGEHLTVESRTGLHGA